MFPPVCLLIAVPYHVIYEINVEFGARRVSKAYEVSCR